MMFEPWRPRELISLDPRYSKMVPHERWPDIRKSVFALYQIKLKDGHTGLSLMLTQVKSVSLKPIILFYSFPFSLLHEFQSVSLGLIHGDGSGI